MAHVIVGTDGLCTCTCGDRCLCDEHNTGSGSRCTAKQLEEAGHTPVMLADKESDEEYHKFVVIDGKRKKIKVKCIYER